MSFDFITEMAWKSALISGAALLLAALLRSRAAADRAAILRIAVGLLLLLPLISIGLPALTVEALSAPEPLAAAATPPLAVDAAFLAALPEPQAEPLLEPLLDTERLICLAYLAGLLAVALRLGAGLWTLRRWTGNAEEVRSSEWIGALGRAREATGAGRPVRLLVSDAVPAPLSWGLVRPVILIDRAVLARPEEAEAILGHEYAHVARGDWSALMLSRAAAALFWFNPLVWLLEREVVQNAEEAADNQALRCVEATRYAQTLVNCARATCNARIPANSMAPTKGGMTRRVRAALDGARRRTPSGTKWTLLALAGCTAFAGPLAALKLVAPAASTAALARSSPPAPAPASPAAHRASAASPALLAPPAPLPLSLSFLQGGKAKEWSTRDEQRMEEVRRRADEIEARVDESEVRAEEAEARAREAEIRAEEAGARAEERRERALDEAERRRDKALERASEARWRAFERAMDRKAAQAEAAGRNAAWSGARAARAGEQAARAAEIANRYAGAKYQEAMAESRNAMARSAIDMEKGARDMERGARRMQEEADKLLDRDYRETVIARQAGSGRINTHEELIRAVPKMREGSRNMLNSAAEMRRSAEKMRRDSEG